MNGVTDIANSIIDDVQAVADSPLISLIGLVFPQANSIIDIIRRYEPTIDAAQPVITAAVNAGIPVFEAAVAAAPKFATVVSALTHLMPSSFGSIVDPAVVTENIARLIGGFPRMTLEQEKRWMDLATPGNDPSQENSKFTVG